MKRIILLIPILIFIISCNKENEEIPFVPANYEFSKNSFVGKTKSYNSQGLISSEIEFNEDFFQLFQGNCYLMKNLKFISDNELVLFFEDGREDSVIQMNYIKEVNNIILKRISENGSVPEKILFYDYENKIQVPCTGVKLVLKQSVSNGIIFGEYTSEQFQQLIDYLQEGEMIYLNQMIIEYVQE